MKLSIIIPALNEAEFITSTLDQVAGYLKAEKLLDDTEVLVVVADSHDDTAKLAVKASGQFEHFQLVQPGPKAGKGRDVRVGMLTASGEYRLFMDADLATPLHHIKEGLELLESKQGDIAYGARHLWSIHETLNRKVTSVGANMLVQSVLLPGIRDTQCGFKLFRWSTCENLFKKQTLNGWGFDFELLALARKCKLKLLPLEVTDWRDPKAGEGLDGGNGAAITSTLKELWQVRRNLWRGHYR